MGILSDFFKRAQELRNETVSGETEQPSSQSVDDPTNSLEFVDRTDQKKNRVPGPHGDSLNKTAQSKQYDIGDRVVASDDVGEDYYVLSGVIVGIGIDDNGKTFYSIEFDDGKKIDLYGEHFILAEDDNSETDAEQLIQDMFVSLQPTPTPDELEKWHKESKFANPFHVAQVKETGHDDGEMSDHETAETGNIGGNFDPSSSYNGGGRTPGKLDNPTPNNRVQHDTEYDAKHEQITP